MEEIEKWRDNDDEFPIREYDEEKNELVFPSKSDIDLKHNCLLIPVFCHLCGKRLEKIQEFYRTSDEDWEKYIPPFLQNWVVCLPCYRYLKKIYPDGWKKSKMPIYVVIPSYPVEEENRNEILDILRIDHKVLKAIDDPNIKVKHMVEDMEKAKEVYTNE